MAVATDESVIRSITRRIVERFDPDKIILFGSRARGDAKEESDYDVLIVAPTETSSWKRTVPVRRALSDVPASIDIVWWTPEEIDDWRLVRSHFITTAVREGKTLYAKDPRGSCSPALVEGGE